jgi:hypothetical protein
MAMANGYGLWLVAMALAEALAFVRKSYSVNP